jgi:hypothetical protein
MHKPFVSWRSLRENCHAEVFEIPGFRVVSAIAGLPVMMIELCYELLSHYHSQSTAVLEIDDTNCRKSAWFCDKFLLARDHFFPEKG